jgi:hypothetical protein
VVLRAVSLSGSGAGAVTDFGAADDDDDDDDDTDEDEEDEDKEDEEDMVYMGAAFVKEEDEHKDFMARTIRFGFRSLERSLHFSDGNKRN